MAFGDPGDHEDSIVPVGNPGASTHCLHLCVRLCVHLCVRVCE